MSKWEHAFWWSPYISSNIESLDSKFIEFSDFISKLELCIFCLSETWLNESVIDREIAINGYKVYRNDRNEQRGGGVAVFVSGKLNILCSQMDINVDFEQITLQIKYNYANSKPFYITCVYRPPNIELDCDIFFSSYEQFNASEHIIIGDVNVNLLNANKEWKSTAKSFGYTQLINKPTRVQSSSSLIDHIYVNKETTVINSGVIEIGISDHFVIYICRKVNAHHKYNKCPQNIIRYRNWKSVSPVDIQTAFHYCDFSDLYTT